MTTAALGGTTSDFAAGASSAPAQLGQQRRDAETRLRERLDALGRLAAGWDGEDAKPIDRLALSVGRLVVEQAIGAGLPQPDVFPVPDGGVQLEWAAGPVEIELEIEPGQQGIVFVCDDEQAGQQIDGQLPRDESRFRLALARLQAYA